MGKNKIRIAKIESARGRKATYRGRMGGLVKKAKELSILCDVPVLLVAASPNDEFTLTVGHNSNFEDIIKQYADQTPETRQKSKLLTIENLKKPCSEDGNSLDIEQMHPRSPSSPKNKESEQKIAELEKMKDEISKIEHSMGPLGQILDLDKIESLDTLIQMESCLLNALRLNDLKRAAADRVEASLRSQDLLSWDPLNRGCVTPQPEAPAPVPVQLPNDAAKLLEHLDRFLQED